MEYAFKNSKKRLEDVSLSTEATTVQNPEVELIYCTTSLKGRIIEGRAKMRGSRKGSWKGRVGS